MTKNPYANAILAAAFIALMVSIMHYGRLAAGERESLLIAIATPMVFVLSVAAVSYIALFRPAHLYFTGESGAALRFFLKTLAVFALITLGILAAAFALPAYA